MSQSFTDRVWALDLVPPLKLTLLSLARSADDAGFLDRSLAPTYLQQTGYDVNQTERLFSNSKFRNQEVSGF